MGGVRRQDAAKFDFFFNTLLYMHLRQQRQRNDAVVNRSVNDAKRKHWQDWDTQQTIERHGLRGNPWRGWVIISDNHFQALDKFCCFVMYLFKGFFHPQTFLCFLAAWELVLDPLGRLKPCQQLHGPLHRTEKSWQVRSRLQTEEAQQSWTVSKGERCVSQWEIPCFWPEECKEMGFPHDGQKR